jgi:hypothetical protein
MPGRLRGAERSARSSGTGIHRIATSGKIIPTLAAIVTVGQERRCDLTEMLSSTNVLEYLEEAYSKGDAGLQERISVSFLEDLPGSTEGDSQIRGMLGQTADTTSEIFPTRAPIAASLLLLYLLPYG